jgi:hypothetical protein
MYRYRMPVPGTGTVRYGFSRSVGILPPRIYATHASGIVNRKRSTGPRRSYRRRRRSGWNLAATALPMRLLRLLPLLPLLILLPASAACNCCSLGGVVMFNGQCMCAASGVACSDTVLCTSQQACTAPPPPPSAPPPPPAPPSPCSAQASACAVDQTCATLLPTISASGSSPGCQANTLCVAYSTCITSLIGSSMSPPPPPPTPPPSSSSCSSNCACLATDYLQLTSSGSMVGLPAACGACISTQMSSLAACFATAPQCANTAPGQGACSCTITEMVQAGQNSNGGMPTGMSDGCLGCMMAAGSAGNTQACIAVPQCANTAPGQGACSCTNAELCQAAQTSDGSMPTGMSDGCLGCMMAAGNNSGTCIAAPECVHAAAGQGACSCTVSEAIHATQMNASNSCQVANSVSRGCIGCMYETDGNVSACVVPPPQCVNTAAGQGACSCIASDVNHYASQSSMLQLSTGCSGCMFMTGLSNSSLKTCMATPSVCVSTAAGHGHCSCTPAELTIWAQSSTSPIPAGISSGCLGCAIVLHKQGLFSPPGNLPVCGGVPGCMDSFATNFNMNATVQILGNCSYHPVGTINTQITVNVVMSSISAPSARLTFENNFRQDIANLTNCTASQIIIDGMRPGSVIVDFSVTPTVDLNSGASTPVPPSTVAAAFSAPVTLPNVNAATTSTISAATVQVTPAPVDCVGNWSAYIGCSVTCGTGRQSRSFTISTPRVTTGNDCPTFDQEVQTQLCTMPACTIPTASSCSDTVQNGDETGVDCGGSCSACPTCSDTTRNGDETGTDCGGSCTACSNDDDDQTIVIVIIVVVVVVLIVIAAVVWKRSTRSRGGDDAKPEKAKGGSNVFDAAAQGKAGYGDALAVGWVAKIDQKTNREYYVNTTTRQSTWTKPTASGSGGGSGGSRAVRGGTAGGGQQGQWRARRDPQGRTYYVNPSTRQTVWQLPPGAVLAQETNNPLHR